MYYKDDGLFYSLVLKKKKKILPGLPGFSEENLVQKKGFPSWSTA